MTVEYKQLESASVIGVIDSVGQWVVGLPSVAQVAVLLATVVPLAGVVAIVMMRLTDVLYRLLRRRPRETNKKEPH